MKAAAVRRIRFWVTFLGVLILLAAASTGVYRLRQVQASVTLPVAPARKGEFLVIIRCRGQLKAARSVDVYVPLVPQPRVAWLAPDGGLVKQGDPIVKLDSSATQQQLDQMQAQLVAAQATLDQALAQARVDTEQDRSDFADSQFTVEKARLEASKQEIVSRIQGEESKIDLGVAEQKLKVEEATVDLHKASNASKIASLTRQRDKAQADVNLMKSRIAQMEIKAPLTGFIVFQPNYSQGWMNAKPFKVGDNVWPGGALAEMPDLETLQMDATVEETDRGRISIGQDVRVRVDALPELTMAGKVSQISLLAEQSFEFPPTRSFRAYAAIPHPDSRLRPGMNAGMDIVINRIPGAISIPSKALFTRAGKPVVFLAESNRYRPVQVQVLARNPDEVAIAGVPAGAMIALADPDKKEKKP
ncbi:MAG: efflux RND transporter periplasmic adaptor subunit [Bryobacteraceae bacterium]